ncbi:MAG TPA: magnesium transporter CorA family protein [Candidatus Limnocylindrales bacterium]|nr:magnesium transporter CorA family protein [Candidatus Limnocylindrales bacterium]
MIRTALSSIPGSPAHDLSFEDALTWLATADETPDELLWMDCGAPAPDELEALEKTLGLHPLTVEDLTHRNQRAKLEEYPGYLFLVVHWFASADTTAHPHELHFIVGRNWIATIYDDRRILPVEEAWQAFLRGHAREPHGADGELYRLLDHLVDSHAPILATIEDRLEHLSIQASRGDGMQGDIGRVVIVRRALMRVRRQLAPQRDVIGALSRREHGFISQKSLFYFRDVSDHIHREYESIESLRELAQSVMEVQLALVERQQNQVIQRLTVLSTIFLPLNFLTGFFGMNFAHLPFDDDRLLMLAIAAMALLPTVLLLWFRRKGWFGG